MDLLYYLAIIGLLITIPSLAVGTIIFLVKPHLINKRLPKRHLSRAKIFGGGLLASVVSLIIFSSVIAATEPASVKQARVESEAAATKALQLKQRELDSIKQVEAAKSKIEVKQVVVVQTVAFEQLQQDDSNLPKGQTKITQTGVNGERTVTYNVTYTDGREISRQQTSDVVTRQPIAQITANGTYVAPVSTPTSSGGGYTNSSGNYVASPSSNPTGASAQCGDGTYSYSQHRSGTCSHHGGVAVWF